MITPELKTAVLQHTIQGEKAAGIDFLTWHVEELEREAAHAYKGQITRAEMAVTLRLMLELARAEMKGIVAEAQVAQNKRPYLDKAQRIHSIAEMLVAMIEEINNGQ